MSDVVTGAVITGLVMIITGVIGGRYALKGKKTPEPTPVEKLWDRLDAQDARIDTLRGRVEDQDGHIARLQTQVHAYRGGFLAHVSWADRIRSNWTGSTPIIPFTAAEEAAIRRGLELSELEDLT